jgi:hypothetical protein
MTATRDISTPRQVACEWLADGHRVIAATLIERIGSAPLDPGAEMHSRLGSARRIAITSAAFAAGCSGADPTLPIV